MKKRAVPLRVRKPAAIDPRITPELLAKAAKVRAAAEGPERAALEQQARDALRVASLSGITAALKTAREKSGISIRELEVRSGIDGPRARSRSRPTRRTGYRRNAVPRV